MYTGLSITAVMASVIVHSYVLTSWDICIIIIIGKTLRQVKQ